MSKPVTMLFQPFCWTWPGPDRKKACRIRSRPFIFRHRTSVQNWKPRPTPYNHGSTFTLPLTTPVTSVSSQIFLVSKFSSTVLPSECRNRLAQQDQTCPCPHLPARRAHLLRRSGCSFRRRLCTDESRHRGRSDTGATG